VAGDGAEEVGGCPSASRIGAKNGRGICTRSRHLIVAFENQAVRAAQAARRRCQSGSFM
jgi:hypothetical protein